MDLPAKIRQIQIQHLLKLNMQELLETLLGCVYNSNTTLVKVKFNHPLNLPKLP